MTRRRRSVAGRGALSILLLGALAGAGADVKDPALGIGAWAGAQQLGKGAEIIEVRGQSPAALASASRSPSPTTVPASPMPRKAR